MLAIPEALGYWQGQDSIDRVFIVVPLSAERCHLSESSPETSF